MRRPLRHCPVIALNSQLVRSRLITWGTVGIRSFGSRVTKRFARGDRHRLPPRLAPKIVNVLERLESISSPADLREAGYRVHRPTGDRKGSHAVRISGAWRVVFRFRDSNAYDVEAVDYHRS